MPIRLELLTEDPDGIQLATRYWAMNEAGNYLEKVNALASSLPGNQSGTLAHHIRQLCRAFDENLTCPSCNSSMEVKTRSAAKKHPQKSRRLCPNCEAGRVEHDKTQKALAATELEKCLAAHIARLPSDPIDYSALRDDHVLLLLALDIALSPRQAGDVFSLHDCRTLAPTDVEPFVYRLKEAGIIRENPRLASPGTYFMQESNLMVRPARIAWSLAPDWHSDTEEEVMGQLRNRKFSDGTLLFDLWLDYATADAMRYLADKCSAFDQYLDDTQLDEIKTTLHHALKTHSISQIWFVIWKCVKDAASLAQLVYYTATRAAATIPGKIRRTLEKVEKNGTDIRKWDRPEQQPAGTLGMLFNDLFDIDEDTTGVEVLDRLVSLSVDEPDYDDEWLAPESARQLLCDALINDAATEMLYQFATLIRDGLKVGPAIANMLPTSRPASG